MITDDISNLDEIIEKIKNYKVTDIVKNVTSKDVYEIGSGSINLALLDFGSKQNIINSLIKRNCKVTVFPSETSSNKILQGNFDGLVLSNGPGDPEDNKISIQTIKEIYESDFNKPILGICLGHQLMGLATGAKTYKLKYGHRGPNHPVKNIEKDRIFITSQNHGYAIDEKTVNPEIAKVSDINMNDGTVEGLKYIKKDIYTVQFHPEACPGPEDNSYIFDEFLERIKKYAKK
jgi:carbamoyl-phosphate synthase small subunit